MLLLLERGKWHGSKFLYWFSLYCFCRVSHYTTGTITYHSWLLIFIGNQLINWLFEHWILFRSDGLTTLIQNLQDLQICLVPATVLLKHCLNLPSSVLNYTYHKAGVKIVLGCIHGKSNMTWMQHKWTPQLFICSH